MSRTTRRERERETHRIVWYTLVVSTSRSFSRHLFCTRLAMLAGTLPCAGVYRSDGDLNSTPTTASEEQGTRSASARASWKDGRAGPVRAKLDPPAARETERRTQSKPAHLGDRVADDRVGLELVEEAKDLLRARLDVLEHALGLERVLDGARRGARDGVGGVRAALRASLWTRNESARLKAVAHVAQGGQLDERALEDAPAACP